MTSIDADASSQPPPTAIDRIEREIGAFFRPRDLDRIGLNREGLRALIRRGEAKRVGRGVYRLARAEATEHFSLALACARVPNSIVCLLSALRVHEIGTQSPPEVWLAIPHKARSPRLRTPTLHIVRFTGVAWTQGVVSTSFEGVAARITSPARTIVDCFRFEGLLGPEAPMEALTDALRRGVVTVAELSHMEKMFPSRRLSAAPDIRSI